MMGCYDWLKKPKKTPDIAIRGVRAFAIHAGFDHTGGRLYLFV
jgi:hypothetical protein